MGRTGPKLINPYKRLRLFLFLKVTPLFPTLLYLQTSTPTLCLCPYQRDSYPVPQELLFSGCSEPIRTRENCLKRAENRDGSCGKCSERLNSMILDNCGTEKIARSQGPSRLRIWNPAPKDVGSEPCVVSTGGSETQSLHYMKRYWMIPSAIFA